jgi:hypothetical protein
MTKLTLTLITAVLLVGLLSWKSDATALTSHLAKPTAPMSYAIHKAGCLLAGRYCRVGYHWVCGLPPNPERRRCHCVPC